jgi:hypothetical protein
LLLKLMYGLRREATGNSFSRKEGDDEHSGPLHLCNPDAR